MHFGMYLKNKGVINAGQLVAALEAQLEKLVPIGQLALEEGLISARDIFEILRAQSQYPNVRFGELAIEMGLLKREELMRLLMIQADRKKPLGDILVLQGVLSKQQLAAEVSAYRQANGRARTATTVKGVRVVPAPRLQEALAPSLEKTVAV